VFVDIGNGNLVQSERIVRVVAWPAENRLKRKAHCRGIQQTIDLCEGHQIGSLIYLDSTHVVASPMRKQQILTLMRNGQGGVPGNYE
jgi:regulator of extracellular matrix RemA (YlzA/DUF370 family)